MVHISMTPAQAATARGSGALARASLRTHLHAHTPCVSPQRSYNCHACSRAARPPPAMGWDAHSTARADGDAPSAPRSAPVVCVSDEARDPAPHRSPLPYRPISAKRTGCGAPAALCHRRRATLVLPRCCRPLRPPLARLHGEAATEAATEAAAARAVAVVVAQPAHPRAHRIVEGLLRRLGSRLHCALGSALCERGHERRLSTRTPEEARRRQSGQSERRATGRTVGAAGSTM